MKKKSLKTVRAENEKPFVSVVCVTFNRRPFIRNFLQMIKNQDYPQSRFEVIFVDDGTDPIKDVVESCGMPNVKYVRVEEKMPLGKKRNFSHTLIDARTKYIVPMDDDDFVMNERISHSVETLERNPRAMCAGSSEMYLYFKHIKKLYKFGPYMVDMEVQKKHEEMTRNVGVDQYVPLPTNHATNGTFAYRRELINTCRYNEGACLAEEKEFLKGYTIPMVQLNPFKCILCISHEHNTFDKRKLLENPHPSFVRPSDKDLKCFFKSPQDAAIQRFFMEDVDAMLEAYAPGHPRMKPDVLKQIKEIEADRAKIMEEQQRQQQQQQQQQGNMPQFVIQQPGQPPQTLSPEDIVQLLKQNQAQIEYLTRHQAELEGRCQDFQKRLMEKTSVLGKTKRELNKVKADIHATYEAVMLPSPPQSAVAEDTKIHIDF